MSKAKVKINYGGNTQSTKVQQFQKGPIKYDNLYDLYHTPIYQLIQVQASPKPVQVNNPQKRNIVESNVQVLRAHKSEQNLASIKPTYSVYPAQNNTQTTQSIVAINTKFPYHPAKKQEQSIGLNKISEKKHHEAKKPNQNLQVSPASIEYDSDREKLKIRHIIQSQATKQIIRQSQETQKNRLIQKKQTINSDVQSPKKKHTLDTNQIKQINQAQFNLPPSVDPYAKNVAPSQQTGSKKLEPIKQSLNPNDVVIKAPTFRQVPKKQGQSMLKANKIDYVKGEGQEKYLYNGIPQTEESNFMGCFGCCRPKPKTFSVGKYQNR